ncbi:MAG: class I SAM-dependent methyltransferase [Pseudobdellovibrio sp.]|nr:class I SAM-dependent methyltransferase [Pseudobdellovibrio sp.]
MRHDKQPSYEYIENCYGPENEQMQLSRKFADQLGLGGISVSQTEAHLMGFLVSLIKPKKVVEIGTLTGLSCQYFLQSLQQDGMVYTLEKSTEHIELSSQALKPWIDRGQAVIMAGDAREELPKLSAHGPFDAIFIDGNKAAYKDYWMWAKSNIRSGGMILIDNVFLAGAVWGDTSKQKFSDKQINTVKDMTSDVFADANLTASFVPTEEGLIVAVRK